MTRVAIQLYPLSCFGLDNDKKICNTILSIILLWTMTRRLAAQFTVNSSIQLLETCLEAPKGGPPARDYSLAAYYYYIDSSPLEKYFHLPFKIKLRSAQFQNHSNLL